MNIENMSNSFYATRNKNDKHSAKKIENIFLSNNEKLPKKVTKEVSLVAKHHFFNPVLSAEEIIQKIGISKNRLKSVYSVLSNSTSFQNILTSDYYPYAMMMRYSKRLLNDLQHDPKYFNKLLEKKPLSPKRLEIHATHANCNLSCKMCLWKAGKNKLEYTNKEVRGGVLSVEQWKSLLKDAKKLGTETVIFSGGGEPQLREESYKIIKFARKIGQKVLIYTNGTKLKVLADKKSPLYKEFLKSDWLRVSLHAAKNTTYSKLVGLSNKRDNLKIVKDGIIRLIEDRDKNNRKLKIGVNIVIQDANFNELEDYILMAKNLKVDFVNFRVDCVNITKCLNSKQNNKIYDQLRKIRKAYHRGEYGNMFIDFADVLIASMNKWDDDFVLKPTKKCRVHQYRSAINPFGRVATCDLMAEPHYSCDKFTLGYLKKESYKNIIQKTAPKEFPGNKCNVCMPGQISINRIYNKIVKDYKNGINLEEQFFA